MNVFCMAVIDLHSWACWSVKPLPLLVEHIHLSRKSMIAHIRHLQEREKVKGQQRSMDQFVEVPDERSSSSAVKKKRKPGSGSLAASSSHKRPPKPELVGQPFKRLRGKQQVLGPLLQSHDGSDDVGAGGGGGNGGSGSEQPASQSQPSEQTTEPFGFSLLHQIRRQVSTRL